jgi:hypothetical protein
MYHEYPMQLPSSGTVIPKLARTTEELRMETTGMNEPAIAEEVSKEKTTKQGNSDKESPKFRKRKESVSQAVTSDKHETTTWPLLHFCNVECADDNHQTVCRSAQERTGRCQT